MREVFMEVTDVSVQLLWRGKVSVFAVEAALDRMYDSKGLVSYEQPIVSSREATDAEEKFIAETMD